MATGKEQPETLEVTVKAIATSVDKFGRPSKLTADVIAQAWKYLNDTTSIAASAGGLMPTKERLALTIGVSRNTMYEWAKQSEDFQDILDTLDAMQADMLLQNGLMNRYNSTITKLMLSKHGYVEKQEIDQNLNVVTPILSGMAKQADQKVIETDAEN